MKSKCVCHPHNLVYYGCRCNAGGGKMTKAQKWARERNGIRFILGGMRKNLISLSEKPCLLNTEKKELIRAVLFLNETISSWKTRTHLSKKKFMEGGK